MRIRNTLILVLAVISGVVTVNVLSRPSGVPVVAQVATRIKDPRLIPEDLKELERVAKSFSQTDVSDRSRQSGLPCAFSWAQIESTNYVDYIQNLRSVGCPEATIRDIVMGELSTLQNEDGPPQAANSCEIMATLFGAEKPTTFAGEIVGAEQQAGSPPDLVKHGPQPNRLIESSTENESQPRRLVSAIGRRSEESSNFAEAIESEADDQTELVDKPLFGSFDTNNEELSPEEDSIAVVGEEIGDQEAIMPLNIPVKELIAFATNHRAEIKAIFAAWTMLKLTEGNDEDAVDIEIVKVAADLVGAEFLSELRNIK